MGLCNSTLGGDPSSPSTVPPSRREPSSSEPSRSEPSSSEPSRSEPSRREPSRREPSRREPSRREPSSSEPSRSEPSRSEPSSSEPSRSEPSRSEPSRREPSRREPSRREPSSSEPSRSEPSSSEPSSSEPSSTNLAVEQKNTSCSKSQDDDPNSEESRLDKGDTDHEKVMEEYEIVEEYEDVDSRMSQNYNFSVKIIEILNAVHKPNSNEVDRGIYSLANGDYKSRSHPQVLKKMFSISKELLDGLDSLLEDFNPPERYFNFKELPCFLLNEIDKLMNEIKVLIQHNEGIKISAVKSRIQIVHEYLQGLKWLNKNAFTRDYKRVLESFVRLKRQINEKKSLDEEILTILDKEIKPQPLSVSYLVKNNFDYSSDGGIVRYQGYIDFVEGKKHLVEQSELLDQVICARTLIINFMKSINDCIQNQSEDKREILISLIDDAASKVDPERDLIKPNDDEDNQINVIKKRFFIILSRCKVLYGDINLTDILHRVLIKDCNDLNFIKMLLEQGAKIENHCRFQNHYRGCTALHIAAARNNIEICKWFIESGKIDVNLIDANGETALDKVKTRELWNYFWDKGCLSGDGMQSLHSTSATLGSSSIHHGAQFFKLGSVSSAQSSSSSSSSSSNSFSCTYDARPF
jgi:hypothetical protein